LGFFLLLLPQGIVDSLLFKQFVMGSPFFNFTTIKDDNFITMGYCGKAMRDSDVATPF
jgi:hypothetical protein